MIAWGFQTHRSPARRALGLRGSGMGRILGLGSGRKCFAAPMDHRHRFPSFGDDAGKARHDEGVERLAGVHHFHALHSRHDAHSLRRCQFRSRLCAIFHRHAGLSAFLAIVFVASALRILEKSRLPAQRQSTRLAGLPRVQLSVQQSHSARRMLRGSLGHALPGPLRMGAGNQNQRRPSVLQ